MAYMDISSIQHRLDNLAKHSFVVAYAEIRAIVMHSMPNDELRAELVATMMELEATISSHLGIALATLQDHLIFLGEALQNDKDAEDEGENVEG